MAGGKRFKWQGSAVRFTTSYDDNSPSLVPTAITKADPAVVTITSHGLSDGDAVYVRGVGGMTELNGEQFLVNVLTANTFQLLGVNSTDYGTFTSGGYFDKGTYSQLCELTGFNRTGGTSPEIDATSICSTAAEFEIGLPDFGTAQLDYNFAPSVTVQQSLDDFYQGTSAGLKIAYKITLPGTGGTLVQLGFIQQTSDQGANGALWTGSTTLRLTGKRYYFAA
jgi:hypothetical protein